MGENRSEQHQGLKFSHGANLMEETFGEHYSPHLPSEEMIEAALDALSLETGPRERDWIFDSGASAHFSEDKNLFQFLDPPQADSVTSVGGQAHVIEGEGSARVSFPSGEIKALGDVQYVPGLYHNIVLIGKLTASSHIAFFYSSTYKVLTKTKHNRVDASRRRSKSNGLYKPTAITEPLAHNAEINVPDQDGIPSHNSAPVHLLRLWHCRLGHINFASLTLLNKHKLAAGKPQFLVISQTCIACQQGKQTRERFPSELLNH
uniref:Uncharacterized protein n=1 Tax=Physcomitrium patens TaxID=3218 RepID=A0A2K1IIK9_PHYPA|nr:hypothetical protein PHYPA_027805 [Physcomitrium patens]